MTAMILRRRKLGLGSCRGFREASETGISFIRNDLMNRVNWDNIPLVIRWGCTSNSPVRNVLNKSEAIHLANDKPLFRRKLQEEGENLVPKTWFSLEDFIEDDQYPVIVRPKKHAQGKHVYKCLNIEDLMIAIRNCGVGFYISEYIEKQSEYRVFIVQGRVVWVAQKTPGNPNDVAWNVAKGGRFDNVRWDDWPLQAVRKSIEAFNLSGLDFGGVDVMVGRDNNSYIIEINSAPSHPLNEDGSVSYRQRCTAKVFDYIVRNGKEHIPLIDERGGYRKFIHPAIYEGALV